MRTLEETKRAGAHLTARAHIQHRANMEYNGGERNLAGDHVEGGKHALVVRQVLALQPGERGKKFCTVDSEGMQTSNNTPGWRRSG